MKEQNINPFEYKYDVTTIKVKLAKLHKDKCEPGEEDEKADVYIVGYIMMRRSIW